MTERKLRTVWLVKLLHNDFEIFVAAYAHEADAKKHITHGARTLRPAGCTCVVHEHELRWRFNLTEEKPDV